MKKNNLWIGLVYTFIGVVCLVTAVFFETLLNDLLFAFSGAGIMSGLVMLFRYFYWSSDKNKDRYAERMENEHIDLHDERKNKLRDRSGRYAYILGLAVLAAAIVIFSVLGQLNITLNTNTIIVFLSAYLLFQYFAGIVIYRHLNSKY